MQGIIFAAPGFRYCNINLFMVQLNATITSKLVVNKDKLASMFFCFEKMFKESGNMFQLYGNVLSDNKPIKQGNKTRKWQPHNKVLHLYVMYTTCV